MYSLEDAQEFFIDLINYNPSNHTTKTTITEIISHEIEGKFFGKKEGDYQLIQSTNNES